jgi:hypothetical protein
LPSFIAKKEIMAITFQQLFFITFSPLSVFGIAVAIVVVVWKKLFYKKYF